MMSGVIFQPFIGYLLDKSAQSRIDFVPGEYSIFDYQIALTVLPVAMLIATLMKFKMKEAYPKP